MSQNNKNQQQGDMDLIPSNSSDHHVISSFNIKTMSTRQVMRIAKSINKGILVCPNNKFCQPEMLTGGQHLRSPHKICTSSTET